MVTTYYANYYSSYLCISNYRAVDEIWKKSVYEYLSVDTSEDMEDLAKKLRRGKHINTMFWENVHIMNSQLFPGNNYP